MTSRRLFLLGLALLVVAAVVWLWQDIVAAASLFMLWRVYRRHVDHVLAKEAKR